MQLHQLHAFLAVAQDLSFRRAASRLCLSQPALSAQIADLERHLGVRLFHRDRSGTRLTGEGAALVPIARSAVAAVAQVELAARRSPQYRRVFTAGVLDRGVGDLTWPLLRTFHDARPDLDLNVVHVGFSDALSRLRSGLLDVLLAVGPFGEEDGETTTVGETTVPAILPAWHPRADAASADLGWLAARVSVRPPPGMGTTFTAFWTLQDAGGPSVERLRVVDPRSGVIDLLRMVSLGSIGPWPANVPVAPDHRLVPLEVDRAAPLQVVVSRPADPDARQFCELALRLGRSLRPD